MVIQLLSFFFENPKSEVADLCKSTLLNAFQILKTISESVRRGVIYSL